MVDMELMRNGSGCWDPTAHDAITECLKEGKDMALYKGDIFEIENSKGAMKYAVVLAVHVKFATILVLSEDDKLPYKVSCKGMKYVDPGMIQYTYNERFKVFIRSMKEDEFSSLFNAVIKKLGYESAELKNEPKNVPAESVEFVRDGQFMIPETEQLKTDLLKVRAERDVYRSLYKELTESLMAQYRK